MPFAVTHVLVPLLLADIFRNFTRFGKKHITRRMVLFAGICGLLPDLDIPVFLAISHFSSMPITSIHRTITHSIFIPLIGLLFFAIFNYGFKTKKMHIYALLFAFGTFSHPVLDGVISGTVMPFYPISETEAGIDLLRLIIPETVTGSQLPYRLTLLAGLDAILLVAWLLYEEYKNKIKDYI